MYESPLIACFAQGLATELLIACDPGQAPGYVLSEVDAFLHQRRLVLPAYGSEQDLAGHGPEFEDLPVPGYLVLEPGIGAEGVLAETSAQWTESYALEDNPIGAVAALAQHIHEEMGGEHKVGRFFRRFADYLVADERTASDIEHMLRSVRAIEDRIEGGEAEFELGENRGVRRSLGLISRLLTGIEIPVRL
jgi:hypothetical protein